MWAIVKQWGGLPATRQPATQERFSTREAAEAKAAALRLLFPGREFHVVPLKEQAE